MWKVCLLAILILGFGAPDLVCSGMVGVPVSHSRKSMETTRGAEPAPVREDVHVAQSVTVAADRDGARRGPADGGPQAMRGAGRIERREGIVTEQDVVRRGVAVNYDPRRTKLGDVMIEGPDIINPDEPTIRGLQMMEDGCYRHLPVVCNGRILGVLSRSDYLSDEQAELARERRLRGRIA